MNQDHVDLLIRIDERTQRMDKKMDGLQCERRSNEITDLKARLKPIENIFWKIILTALIGGSIAGAISSAATQIIKVGTPSPESHQTYKGGNP